LDFGNGWIKIGAAHLAGNTSLNLNNIQLAQAAKRA